ncbi:glycosyltransferase family 22 protein [Amanita muscaria Koide BX008]|uniref:Mannosyltransferase n=1 Tax=Amanita muscaria (strain Koide BX008) TaxID=946122 RepID=A0A0C2X6M1_AMAMK|nr:glycosyltransferase family 22 protein [Amanita muscaria Koide BX008]
MFLTRARLAILLRISVALLTSTFFQPDEFFQSLEPAHRVVFGYGELTWEWLTPKPIRSIVYPALNIPVYWLLKVTKLAEMSILGDCLLIACPKLLHGSLAALTDIWLCHLTQRVLGERYVSTALFLSLTCFFHALSLSRSLSNSLETSLTTVAFAHYPWDATTRSTPNVYFKRSNIRITLIFSALACMIRPTNGVIWIYLFSKLLWIVRRSKSLFKFILQDAFAIGACAIATMTVLDSLYYGKLTFTPLNFFLTNVSSVSLFYGSGPWHYYFSQALPMLCTTALPFVFHGIWRATRSKKAVALHTMTQLVFWTIGIYSLMGHKEWRFIHPILPLLHLFAARSLDELSSQAKGNPKKQSRNAEPMRTPLTAEHEYSSDSTIPMPSRLMYWLCLPIPVALYVVLLYCSGPISAMSWLRSLPRLSLHNTTIGVLVPCHSLPGQVYLHREEFAHPGRFWALGCEPPLHGNKLWSYKAQTDVFYDSPFSYLRTYFPPRVNTSFPLSPYPATLPGAVAEPSPLDGGRYPWRHEWPTYLIFFGALLEEEGVKELLKAQEYTEIWRKGRSWEGDVRRKGGTRIWKWSAT